MHACVLLMWLSGSYRVVAPGADRVRGSRWPVGEVIPLISGVVLG